MANALQKKIVRVLHLEDNENDHILVAETLSANELNCEFTLAKSRQEFEIALRGAEHDLIISDFTLPSYDGLTALSLARELRPEIPFVFFSGSIGEDIAVDSLQHGAVDYVLKQRPSRLAPAIRRALHNAEEHARLQQAENTLRQAEERFYIIARATNDVIWEWDIQKNKVWFSDNFQTAFGHKNITEGILSEHWFDFIHPEDKNRVISGISTMIASGGKIWWSEHRIRCADNSYAHIFDRASIIYDPAGRPQKMVGVKIDMTERRRTEEKILEQAALLDKAQDAIIICDSNYEIRYWNQGAERIYGWSTSEAVGKNIHNLLFHDNLPQQIQEAVKSLEERGEWIGELTEFTKYDKTVTVQARSTLIRDEQGNPKSLLIINTDITERKQLEEKFFRAQRLDSLGVLVSGIAHDLNNALTPILIGTSILRGENLSADAASILETMDASARRGSDMVRQVLAFARGGESNRIVVRVDRIVKEMGKIITDTFPKNIECHIQVAGNASPVSGIPTQLHQILMNLCVNARDAMPDGGDLTLSVKNIVLTTTEAARYSGAKAGNYLCTSVKDTGTGIPAAQLDKLFQPFFTTKALGKGTGLGLSTSLSIAKNHGGFMTVDSEVGVGSEFKLFLPAVIATVSDDAAPQKRSLPEGEGQCVLVIDDEASMLALIRTTLENYHYRVITAATGPEAIVRLAEKADDISLVITDIEMPFMDGFATIKALHKIKPDLKIIVATGSRQEKSMEGRGLKTEAFISKPFTTDNLLTKVHEVLTRGK